MAVAARRAVRAWTRLYTWRLPPLLRDRRRAEVDSDLWESAHDPTATNAGDCLATIWRLLVGMPDDLRWRADMSPVTARAMAVGAATVVVMMSAMWIYAETRSIHLPPAPPVQRPVDPDLEPLHPPPPPLPGEETTARRF